jgi:hypothetical protein
MAKLPSLKDETQELLDAAEDAWPDSDFVASVQEWYDKRGFITEAQEAALENIIERSEDNEFHT